MTALTAQNPNFHNAPASAKELKNPYEGQRLASAKPLYHLRCARCHGENGEGSGNIPALAGGRAQSASDGELFWYVTKGDVNNGMPSWSTLPRQQRWQIVTYLRVLGGSKPGSPRVRTTPAEAVAAGLSAPPPKAPFTDYRFEKPGKIRKITLQDLPAPFATSSAGNGPQLVPRPEKAWPQVPAGFKVEQYATGLNDPRLIRTAPNGDFFVAESHTGDIRVFRGITAEGKPEQAEIFATGLKRPFGINFFPPGPDPQWIYVGNTDSVLRFPYKNGDLKARGPAEHIADLPGGGGHWTRDIQFTADGKKCSSPSAPFPTLMTRTPLPPKEIALMFWNSIPTAPQCVSSPMVFATASAWPSIQKPASSGVRSTNATHSATISYLTTSRMCRKAVSMASPGGTWEATKTRGTRASIPNSNPKSSLRTCCFIPTMLRCKLLSTTASNFPR